MLAGEAWVPASQETDLVLKAGLNRDLQAVRHPLAILPHVVHQQPAKGGHGVGDRKPQHGDTDVRFALQGRRC